ncbi:hypothetical protein TNCV_3013131 [Trichonephila clavipes]|nr:hypothetical protein TNCV_3013131 [Trichonephila clavipes]
MSVDKSMFGLDIDFLRICTWSEPEIQYHTSFSRIIGEHCLFFKAQFVNTWKMRIYTTLIDHPGLLPLILWSMFGTLFEKKFHFAILSKNYPENKPIVLQEWDRLAQGPLNFFMSSMPTHCMINLAMRSDRTLH